MLKFTKMHGCGNDYVYFDTFAQVMPQDLSGLAVRLSDRHRGIGADGIILIMPSDAAHARMRMFNADGSEGAMCGNGIRCVAKYLYESGLAPHDKLIIETMAGLKHLRLNIAGGTVASVRVDMGRAAVMAINRHIAVGEGYKATCIDMGNPHAVVFCQEVDNLDLAAMGPLFEHNPIFPNGVNTEFIKVLSPNLLKMRVWERGSGETQACGTGACAAAVAACLNGHCEMGDSIKVLMPGGELIINYTDSAVFMEGDCVKTFEGVV